MGFGDKLKGLKDQAQQAVAENKDKIQGAVQVVGDAANTKTHGKYATKIMKVGEKVETSVDKFAASSDEAPADAPAAEAAAAATTAEPETPDPAFNIEGNAPQEECEDAPVTHEPHNPVTPSAADTASSGFPEFE
jgi:hypothetical protein